MSYDSDDEVGVRLNVAGAGEDQGGSSYVEPKEPLDYTYQRPARLFGLLVSTLTTVTFIAAMAILVSEQKMDYFTVNYMVEGDVSANGDTFHNINIACWAFIVGTIVGFVLFWPTNLYRCWSGESTHVWASTVNMFNFYTYFPIALLESLATLALLQSTGLAHFWTMVYSAVSVFGAEVVLCMTRVAQEETLASRIRNDDNKRQYKSAGSSSLSILTYLVCKLVPFCLMAVAVSQRWPGDKIGAAFIIMFSVVGARVLFTAACFWKAIAFSVKYSDHGWFRWIVLRNDKKSYQENDDAANFRTFIRYTSGFGRPPRIGMWVGTVVCLILFVFVTVNTQVDFRSGDRAGLNAFERITSVIYSNRGMTAHPQFDRTWGMGQVFLPIIFGLPALMMVPLIMLQCRRAHASEKVVTIPGTNVKATRKNYESWIEDAWANARDPYNAFAFAVARGFIAWMLLSITGTTEYTELLMAMKLQLVSSMIWTETRKNSSAINALLATLTCLLPFVHATVNYTKEANSSNVELAAVIVLFCAFAFHELLTLWFYVDTPCGQTYYSIRSSDTLKELVKMGVYPAGTTKVQGPRRSFHPERVVLWRYVVNVALIITSTLMIYWLGGMHHHSEIQNSL